MSEELNGVTAPEQVSTSAEPQAPLAPEQSQTVGFRDFVAAKGYDVEGVDDEQLWGSVEHALQRAQRADEYEPLVSQARRYLDRAPEIDAWLAAQEAEQRATAKPAKEEKPSRWKAPLDEYDPNWEAFTEYDPQLRRYVLTEEARKNYISPALAENVTKYKTWQRDNLNHITTNFDAAVKEAMQDALDEYLGKATQTVDAKLSEMLELAAAQKFINDNRTEFFRHDDKGNLLVDQTGQEVPTRYGELFAHFASQIRARNPQMQMEDVRDYAETKARAVQAEEQRLAAEAEKARQKAAKALPPTGAAPAKTTIIADQLATPEQRNSAAKESFVRRSTRGSRIAALANSTPEQDADALKRGRGRSKPNFHDIRKAIAEAEDN